MSKLADIIKEEFDKYATENRQRFDLRFLSSPLILKHINIISGKESIYDIRDEEIIKQKEEVVEEEIQKEKTEEEEEQSFIIENFFH